MLAASSLFLFIHLVIVYTPPIKGEDYLPSRMVCRMDAENVVAPKKLSNFSI